MRTMQIADVIQSNAPKNSTSAMFSSLPETFSFSVFMARKDKVQLETRHKIAHTANSLR